MVLESVGKGIVLRPLSVAVGDDHLDVTLCKLIGVTDEQREVIVNSLLDRIGTKYAIWDAVKVMVRRIFNTHVDREDMAKASNAFFCSWAAAKAQTDAENDLFPNLADKYILPQDFAHTPKLILEGILE